MTGYITVDRVICERQSPLKDGADDRAAVYVITVWLIPTLHSQEAIFYIFLFQMSSIPPVR